MMRCNGFRKETGRQCRRRAKWVVDAYGVCDDCRTQYPFNKLPAQTVAEYEEARK